jgi:transcriptional regulator
LTGVYTPAHFRIDDPDECFDIVERRAAGTLVVAAGGGFEATLLPWVVQRLADGRGLLQGHVSKANPLASLAETSLPALVIFDLVDGYVSPSWYPSKAEHHQVVPTWNYVSVHVHGTVRTVDQPHWLREQIGMLTEEHEADMKVPWSVHDAPDDFIAKMMKGIIGLEFHVERLEGKAKLSQNRSAADRAGVIAGLNAVGDDPLWAAMQEWDHDEDGEE